MNRSDFICSFALLFILFLQINSREINGHPIVCKASSPITISFIYGQNLLEMGTDKLRLDLSVLGTNVFDENTSDFPIFSPDEGWVHYILNPSWHGVLVVWEREEGSTSVTEARYMFIHAGDESLVLPSTVIHDDAGVFVVATQNGVMIRTGKGNGYYVPLSTALGLEEIKDTRLTILDHDPELKQKAVEARFSNASLKGIKIGIENRQIGYLIE